MKSALIVIVITFLLSYKGSSQQYESDSICYYNSDTGKRIRCYIPSLDPGTSTYYSDIWEVKRDGDFIKITHWDRKYLNGEYGIGTITNFQAQSKNEEKITYPYPGKKVKLSNQRLVGIASSTKVYNLVLDWELYDLNNDGRWDRLILSWMEDNSPLVRVIYCHVK